MDERRKAERIARRTQRRADAMRMGVGVLRAADVSAVLGVNLSTLWRWWAREGSFPAPIKLGRNAVGWDALVVREWLSARESAGRAA